MVRSADELLIKGIGDFTFEPGESGILGKGKFSTVFKVQGMKGVEVSLFCDIILLHKLKAFSLTVCT